MSEEFFCAHCRNWKPLSALAAEKVTRCGQGKHIQRWCVTCKGKADRQTGKDRVVAHG